MEFTEQGFPNFRPYSQAEVEIPNLTGKYNIDARLGSGLTDQSQKMTVAARAMAEKKALGHLS